MLRTEQIVFFVGFALVFAVASTHGDVPPTSGCLQFTDNAFYYYYNATQTDEDGSVYYTGYGKFGSSYHTLVYGSTDASNQFSSFSLFYPSKWGGSQFASFHLYWETDFQNARVATFNANYLSLSGSYSPQPVTIVSCSNPADEADHYSEDEINQIIANNGFVKGLESFRQ
eukprot:TRINITY_DN4152_c0_g1_i1.p1 TRINITY_DN4152_c0_g1~~TRINITY_DN4152_c0_g1_i1.p1  ORF type:complete len:171 (+),score=36.06 TRINITY_DN4152_c0_g1_i1:65-577(+)